MVITRTLHAGHPGNGDLRGRELKTNLFFSKFRAPPRCPRKNPRISRQKIWLVWVSQDIPDLLALPLHVEDPTSPEDNRTKTTGLGFFFYFFVFLKLVPGCGCVCVCATHKCSVLLCVCRSFLMYVGVSEKWLPVPHKLK